MIIYVITEYDVDGSMVRFAYVNENEAAAEVERLSSEQEELNRKYNEWVDIGEDTECPDFGDLTYSYRPIELIGT